MQRRSKEQIISQILDVCSEGTNKTTIGYRTNLNLKKVNEYMKLLVKNKLIEPDNGSYRTTSKGFEALVILGKIQDVLTDCEIRR